MESTAEYEKVVEAMRIGEFVEGQEILSKSSEEKEFVRDILDILQNSSSDDLYDQFSERIGNLECPRSEEKLRGDIERLGKL